MGYLRVAVRPLAARADAPRARRLRRASGRGSGRVLYRDRRADRHRDEDMGKTKKEGYRRGLTVPFVVASTLLPQIPVVSADPAAKVHLPTVVQGEAEFELHGGQQWWRDSEDSRERQF